MPKYCDNVMTCLKIVTMSWYAYRLLQCLGMHTDCYNVLVCIQIVTMSWYEYRLLQCLSIHTDCYNVLVCIQIVTMSWYAYRLLQCLGMHTDCYNVLVCIQIVTMSWYAYRLLQCLGMHTDCDKLSFYANKLSDIIINLHNTSDPRKKRSQQILAPCYIFFCHCMCNIIDDQSTKDQTLYLIPPQSHYTDTWVTCSSPTLKNPVPSRKQLVPFLTLLVCHPALNLVPPNIGAQTLYLLCYQGRFIWKENLAHFYTLCTS